MVGSPVKNNQETGAIDNFSEMVQPESWQRNQWKKALNLGFPKNKDENWKYTSLSSFNALEIQKAAHQSIENIDFEGLCLNIDCYRIVFLDGRLLVRCSDWIPKVTVTPLQNLTGVESYELSKSVHPDAFTYLTDAIATAGVLIEIESRCVVEKPIYLFHISSGNTGDSCSYRHHLELGYLSECEVIEHHVSLDQGGGVTFSRMTSYVGEGGHMRHTKLIEESTQQHHFGHNDITLQRNASAYSHCFMLSASLCRHQTSCDLQGENGFVEMNSLSMPQDQQTFDSRTYLKHFAPHCQSEQLHKTIARDKSNGVFDGMIYVTPDALKTDGQMDSHNLLLSNNAQVNCKPQLEIYADDVKCSHGATTGQLDTKQIDYMRARGISKSKAKKMLIFAFASQVALKVRHTGVKDFVLDKLENSFAQGEHNE
ncbi:Fe-S cluster assembly protein SufD [Vibrio kagoshimensis]|uniref:Fe-S cluster assembly protein SufD n=1 Tax=Vibrio kagoshimensis TaxID=2910244 RepID=UPI003D1E6F0A